MEMLEPEKIEKERKRERRRRRGRRRNRSGALAREGEMSRQGVLVSRKKGDGKIEKELFSPESLKQNFL